MIAITSKSVGLHPIGIHAGKVALVVDLAKCASRCADCIDQKNVEWISTFDLAAIASDVGLLTLSGGDPQLQQQGVMKSLRTELNRLNLPTLLVTRGIVPFNKMPNEHVILRADVSHNRAHTSNVRIADEVVWSVGTTSEVDRLRGTLTHDYPTVTLMPTYAAVNDYTFITYLHRLVLHGNGRFRLGLPVNDIGEGKHLDLDSN